MSARSRYLIWGILALSLLAGPGSMAQEATEETLRVARIAHVEGEVTMQRTFDEDWVEATINTPLMEGDKLYTGVDARVEIEMEDEVVVRLDEESFIHFEALDPARTRLGIVQGTVAINARAVGYFRPWVSINTASATAHIVEHANVRVEVDEKGSTEFRVRRGRIEIETGPDSIRRVEWGQRLLVHGPGVFMVVPGVEEDEFDLWCDLRDARSATSVSPEYVSSRVSGYSELDRYGSWIEVRDYGRVWQPQVTVVDWAPYRYGRWTWRNRCGWVWVSDEPWGWVPYHYGRWVYVDRHRWCWVPHEVVVVRRPVWYPALVAFTYADHGSYFSFSIGGGYYDGPCVGWFPLGPRDPYYGWYWYDIHRPYRRDHRDRHYRYENQYVARAVSVVPREDFGRNRYERVHQSTLQLAHADRVKVGLQARESVEERLFKKPTEKAVDVTTRPAPRVAVNWVKKKEMIGARQIERREEPSVPTRGERPSSPISRTSRVTRSAQLDVLPPESEPTRETSIGQRDARPSQPRAERPRQTDIPQYNLEPGTVDRSPRVDISEPARSPQEDEWTRSVPQPRTPRSSREVSPPVYNRPEPRTYSRPAPRQQTDSVYTVPEEPDVDRYNPPSQRRESSTWRSSSSSGSSRPSARPVPPPTNVRQEESSPGRPSSPSAPPASRPSVQAPSAPAPRAPAPAPAPASQPAPNSRSPRGRR